MLSGLPRTHKAPAERMAWFAQLVASISIDLNYKTPARTSICSARTQFRLHQQEAMLAGLPRTHKAPAERMAWFVQSVASTSIDMQHKTLARIPNSSACAQNIQFSRHPQGNHAVRRPWLAR